MDWLTLLVLFALAPSCPWLAPWWTPPQVKAVLEAPSIRFETLGYERLHGGHRREMLVIRTPSEEANFLREHPYIEESGAARLDTSKEIGVFIQFSARPTFLDDAEIVGVEPAGDRLVVHAVIFRRTGMAPMEIGFPWHYIAIPKTDCPITFAKVVITKDTFRPASLPTPSAPQGFSAP